MVSGVDFPPPFFISSTHCQGIGGCNAGRYVIKYTVQVCVGVEPREEVGLETNRLNRSSTQVDHYVKLLLKNFIIIALAYLVFGCADTAVSKKRYFWPPPPNRPRLEWIGAYSSQLDLPMTSGRIFKQVVVGEDAPKTFVSPMDVKSDGKGRVFVADPGGPFVCVYDMTNLELRFISRRNDNYKSRQPISIALAEDGSLYVADRWLGVVLVYAPNEEFRALMDIRKQVGKVAAIAVDKPRKRLLVADTKDHTINVFTLSGEFLFEFGGHGEEDGKFSYPIAMTVNRSGEIVVADAMNARIQIFDGNGRFLRKFGQRGSGMGDFRLIKGVATDSDDNVYVTDGMSHRILIFSSAGEFLLPVGGMYSIATQKVAPGGFVVPQGIDIDQNDTVYVVDQMNRRFQVFQYLSDEYLKLHPVIDAVKQ